MNPKKISDERLGVLLSRGAVGSPCVLADLAGAEATQQQGLLDYLAPTLPIWACRRCRCGMTVVVNADRFVPDDEKRRAQFDLDRYYRNTAEILRATRPFSAKSTNAAESVLALTVEPVIAIRDGAEP